MFFEWEMPNPNNKNYLVKAIGLKLYYVIYSSTTLFIANLICLANIPMPHIIIYHQEYTLTASYFCCWSTALTERKLSMQYTISMEIYVKEAWKPSLHIIACTGESVRCSSYHLSSLFK